MEYTHWDLNMFPVGYVVTGRWRFEYPFHSSGHFLHGFTDTP